MFTHMEQQQAATTPTLADMISGLSAYLVEYLHPLRSLQ
jgi:hypothetical protein